MSGRHQQLAARLSAIGYEWQAEIGRGATTSVHRVRRFEDGCDYALKLLDGVNSKQTMSGFRREAVLLAGIEHPSLVAIHEVGELDRQPYLVMDLVKGESLSTVLSRATVPVEQVLLEARELVGALAVVHRNGLVHQDIKPDNILIGSDGQARLIDFGLARRNNGETEDVTVGTLLYASPEQAGTLRRPVDARSDLYSLGVVLFECLAGRPPFSSSEVGELLRMHAISPAPDLQELVDDVSSGVAAVVAALLAKDPDDRYQSAAELAADLQQLVDEPQAPLVPRTGPVNLADTEPPPLLGRDRELGLLRTAWRDAASGHGQLVVVRGGTGAGKTELLSHLASEAAAAGGLVLQTAAVAGDPVPFDLFRQLIDQHLEPLDRLDRAGREEATAVIQQCAGSGAPLLGSLTPRLAAALGSSGRDVETGQDQFTLALAGMYLNVADLMGPLLLIVDDAHWVDPSSKRVLLQLASASADKRLLLVLGVNEDEVASAAPAEPAGAIDIRLGPLSEGSIAELVRRRLPGSQRRDPLVRLLVARSSGNPLVATEYLRAIIDAGALRPVWGRWEVIDAEIDSLLLPDDTLGLLTARLNELDDGIQHLLASASLMGIRFDPGLLGPVNDLGEDEVHLALRSAIEHGLIETRGRGYAFLHDRLRALAARQLSAEARAALHLRIAEALDPRDPGSNHLDPDLDRATELYRLAQHYIEAGEAAAPQRAASACTAAGRLALVSYSPAEAVTFLSHAASISPEPEPELLLWLGEAQAQICRYDDAVDSLEAALELARDPLARARILTALAETHRAAWNSHDGNRALHDALAELGAPVPQHPWLLLASSLPLLLTTSVSDRLRRWRNLDQRERQRYELIAQLHHTAAYLSASDGRFLDTVSHQIRARHAVTKVGSGPVYAIVQGSFGIMAAATHLNGLAERTFARIRADPSFSTPSIRAGYELFRATAGHISYQTSARPLARVIDDHGQWLTVQDLIDAVGQLILDGASRGDNKTAERYLDLTRRRIELAADDLSTVTVAPAILAAVQGRFADSSDFIDRLVERHPAASTGIFRLMLPATALFSLHEQGEIGQPFDETVDAYHRFGLPPRLAINLLRPAFYHIAAGRVAQLRAASGAERQRRRRQAVRALKDLKKTAHDDLGKSWVRLVAADLAVADGKPWEAIELLDGDRAVHDPPAPLVRFASLQVRARARLALGDQAGASDELLFASALALEHGWPHRLAALAREHPELSPSTSRAAGSSRRFGWPAGATSSGGSLVVAGVERERLAALQQVGEAASRVLDPDELVRLAVDQLVRILRADRGFLFLSPDDGASLVPCTGRDAAGNELPEIAGYSTTVVDQVRTGRRPLVMTGTKEGEALGSQSVVLYGLRSVIAAPLLLEERLLGVVYLDSQVATGIFTQADVGILTAVTNQVALSLETARAAQLEISVQTAQQQRDLADRMRRAFESMADTREPGVVLQRLAASAIELAHLSAAWVVTSGDDQIEILGSGPGAAPVRAALPGGAPLEALLAIERPTAGAGLAVPEQLAELAPEASAWAVLPLRSRTVDLGVLLVASNEVERHLDEDLELLAALVSQGLTAYESASLFARLQDLAHRDDLTGMPNRRWFFELAGETVTDCRSQGRPLAAMMIDIDHFKAVNDSHGHPTGDDVIKVVVSRLGQRLRPTDVIGRYGGEEFAVIAPDTDLEAAYLVAERLREAVAEHPVRTRSGPLEVTISIGVAQLGPAHQRIDAVLADADQALYDAKQGGRNQTRRHRPTSDPLSGPAEPEADTPPRREG